MRPKKLFVGVGNVLQRDDGVGVRAAERMASLPLPPEVEVCEGGTAGLGLAPILERRERVVVVDAIDAGAQPGDVFRLSPDDLRPRVELSASLHDLQLLHALDETRLLGAAPEEVVVFAVQVGDVSTGIGLTPAVEASLDEVLGMSIEALGLPPGILAKGRPGVSAWQGR